MKVTYQALTDVGRKRKGNEDSLFVNPEQKLFVVAEGMGGHAAGEIASSIAVDSINEFVCLTGGDEEITWPFGLDETISYDGNRLKTAVRFANFVDGADVWVIERSGIPRLAQRSATSGSVAVGRPEHLERDLAMKGGVVREKNHTHSATAKRPLDLIGAQGDARLQSDMQGFCVPG